MASPQENVTVKLKRGSWEIEITSPPDKIQQAVESVLAGMASREEAPVAAEQQDAAQNSPEKHFETCRGLILVMWREGWFSSERTLAEVHEEMARRGYHYDRTAVAHALVDVVREGILFRDGTMRNYRYVQKFPTNAQA